MRAVAKSRAHRSIASHDCSGTSRVGTGCATPGRSAAVRRLELEVDEGSWVTAGQVIARLDNADLQAQIEVARAGVQQATADLAEKQRQLRLTHGLANDGVVSQDQLQAAMSRVRVAEAALSQSNANAAANSAQAPSLQGATNGTIGPQGQDATFVTGVNTAGTVRVNNLANLEALLNIIANGMEILGIAWGGPTMIMGFMHMAAGTQDAMKRVLFGAAGVTGGLATPGCINWLVASARDANLFN